MSKKFKGKTCVYCGVATSTTGDHVFAKKLFLELRRDNLPQVPACSPCNGRKAVLEHYLASVLPFGGRHGDAADNLESLVPNRLARNASLHASLDEGMRPVWISKNGLLLPKTSLTLNFGSIEQWLALVVKGLAWYHWKLIIDQDCAVNILLMTPREDAVFQRFRAMRTAQRIRNDVGGGTFSYEAAQGTDNPQVSAWEFSLYGGVNFVWDPGPPTQVASKIGAIVGPRSVFDRPRRRAMWLRGQPNDY